MVIRAFWTAQGGLCMLVTWAMCVSTGRSPFSEVFFICVQLAMAKPAWSQCPPAALRLGMGWGWTGGRSVLSPGLELGAR